MTDAEQDHVVATPCGRQVAAMSTGVRDLALVGAGGLGREAAELVRAINGDRPTWRLVGFFDDDPALQGTSIAGLPGARPRGRRRARRSLAIAVCTARPAIGCSRAPIAPGLDLERPEGLRPGAPVGLSRRRPR